VNLLYEVPVGRGGRFSTGNRVADYALGNWQINEIFTARSGMNYNVIAGGDIANTGNIGWDGYERANLVGDPNAGSCPDGTPVHTPNCWFNTSTLVTPASFTFGNLGRDVMRADHYWNLDMSVFRQFPLWKEGNRLEFRAESFNLPNHVVYGNPNNDVTNPGSFGKVRTTANNARQLQLGLRIVF
jgi:hypothetical protein